MVNVTINLNDIDLKIPNDVKSMESEVIIKENTLDSFPSDVRTRKAEDHSLKNEMQDRNGVVTLGRRNNGIGWVNCRHVIYSSDIFYASLRIISFVKE